MKSKTKAKTKVSKKTKKEIKKAVKEELSKEIETKQYSNGVGFTGFNSGTGKIITHLTAVPQGTQDNQRVGDEIYLKHVQLRFCIQNNVGAAAPPFTSARIMVFQYNSNDTTPTELELLNGSNAVTGGVVSSFSSRNIDYLSIYNVLYDKVFHLSYGSPNANNYGQSSNWSIWKTVNIPLKYCKKKVQYMTGVGTNESTNGLYLFVTSTNALLANNPTIAYEWIINYTDS